MTINFNNEQAPKSDEIKNLRKFQHEVANSLLEFTSAENENIANTRLVSAMLFLLHLSNEIVTSFTFGDENDTKELLNEAIEESKLAYSKNENLRVHDKLIKTNKFVN
tara:strand:- start:806 stop:1129 length:324 start_codon:yes stop_codon:yes gene_type:complete